MPTEGIIGCSEPCPSALLVAFVTKGGTVKNHNPEDIEIDPCRVASVEIVPVEVCVNYDPITGENDYSALYIRFSGIWLKLDGICSNNNQCGYPIIYERTFTANYYLDEYDMGDGEIWYDEWYDFCGELKVFMMLPRTRPYTFCDIELAKLFYPLYSPTNIVPDIETGYPAIFDCTYYPPSPSASAMAAVDYYWMPTYRWQLVPACKLEVYYDEVHSLYQTDVWNGHYESSGNRSGGLYGLYWTDPATPAVRHDGGIDQDLSPFDTTLFASYVAGSTWIISNSRSCPEINNARNDWLATVNENIDNRVYAESPPYTMGETPSVHYLGWNPNPWGQGRTNCTGFAGGYEQRYAYHYTFPGHRHTKTRCRIKITKPEEIVFLASGVVLKIKVIEQYKNNWEPYHQYVFNSSNEPVTIFEEEVTLAFGQEYVVPDVTRNAKPIEFNPFPDCPAADADNQITTASLNNATVTTNEQTIEVRLISYIC